MVEVLLAHVSRAATSATTPGMPYAVALHHVSCALWGPDAITNDAAMDAPLKLAWRARTKLSNLLLAGNEVQLCVCVTALLGRE